MTIGKMLDIARCHMPRLHRVRMSGFALIMALSSVTVQAAELTPEEKSVSGVWKLLRSEQVLKVGGLRANPVYGERGAGYVIYHPSHHFCLFITRAQDDTAHPPMPGDGLNAYCGTWSIDAARMTMFHHTEMDVLPARRNLLRSPHYELREGRLYLFPPIDDKAVATYALIFEKIGDQP